jgi:aspartate/methionine/tyrosine aminotransferase
MAKTKVFKSADDEVLDFGWGDTRGLRKLILSIYKGLSIGQNMPLSSYGYPPYEGEPALVDSFQKLTEYLTGNKYKYVCVTAGCTHAVNASIYSLSKVTSAFVATRDLYYPRYPNMISLTSMMHTKFGDTRINAEDVAIVDSPSNPLGLVGVPKEVVTSNIIWDAAYHTPTYGILPGTRSIDEAKIFCGSMSKLTGINGIRIGWTATNDEEIHSSLQAYARASVCGVSYPSQYLALEILSDQNKLDTYFKKSASLISSNKEEVLKLKNIFGDDRISDYGMFAFFPIDQKMSALFDRAKVKFTSGSDCGASYPSVRINLANTNEQTKEMVKRIKKADRIKVKI